MSGRLRRNPLAIAASVLVLIALVTLVARPPTMEECAVGCVFGFLIFVGELARVTLPGDRVVSPIAFAAAVGYALFFTVGQTAVMTPLAMLIGVQGVSVAAAAGLHALSGRSSNSDVLGRQLLAVAAGCAFFHLLLKGVDLGPTPAKSQLLVGLMVLGALAAVGVDLVLAAAVRSWHLGTPVRPALRDEVRAAAGLDAAVAATGVLIALSSNLMGWYALPVLLLPLLTTQFSFRRFSQIRSTYRQTIRALSRITEVGGYVAEGHSTRVAAYAVSTGRELGMTESELLDLEYAGLMHDIGQLSLAEAIPRGSTLAVPPAERRRIAELGAEIIRSSGTLGHVAVIVERQSDPYRRNRRPADATLPLASRIIKAASAYDDLVSVAPNDARCRADALERLRLGMAYEYDPQVVEALARVVSRTASSGVPVAVMSSVVRARSA